MNEITYGYGKNLADVSLDDARARVVEALAEATTVNGGVPGPEIRLREGQEVVLRVRNGLDEDTSIHWHGLLVPPEMDGVPGVSFDGIPAGETFVYRFPIRQSGTYWYHSHSGFQEQTGIYGPLVIEPTSPEPLDAMSWGASLRPTSVFPGNSRSRKLLASGATQDRARAICRGPLVFDSGFEV